MQNRDSDRSQQGGQNDTRRQPQQDQGGNRSGQQGGQGDKDRQQQQGGDKSGQQGGGTGGRDRGGDRQQGGSSDNR